MSGTSPQAAKSKKTWCAQESFPAGRVADCFQASLQQHNCQRYQYVSMLSNHKLMLHHPLDTLQYGATDWHVTMAALVNATVVHLLHHMLGPCTLLQSLLQHSAEVPIAMPY
eukprot:GHRR01033155.1.p2 GENE.GHRR01033155.1~~GHRR01033155.1.p2  ORF type:complete len:112 (-),score=27.41 GHRR01033155.1:289-624(-)